MRPSPLLLPRDSLGRWLLIAVTTSVLFPGCVRHKERGVVVEAERTQAVLAAGRADQLTFFGDISGDRKTSYFTRFGTSLTQHTFVETGADFDVDIDRTGQRLVFASTRHNTSSDLYLKSVDGLAVTQLTSDPAPDVQPAFSPDGSRIAFASYRSGSWDIWIAYIDGSPPVQVTQGIADEIHPSWSRDGHTLIYCSLPAEGGQWELWLVDAASGGQRRFIGYGLFPEWSPKTDTIVYQRARDRDQRWFSVWTLDLTNGEPGYPTELAAEAHAAMIMPTWSVEGSHIAFSRVDLSLAGQQRSGMAPGAAASNGNGNRPHASTADGAFDVWIMRSDGRAKTRLTDGYSRNYGPVFGPDGRVYFTSDRSGFENVWSVFPGAHTNRSSDVAHHSGPVTPSVEGGESVPKGL